MKSLHGGGEFCIFRIPEISWTIQKLTAFTVINNIQRLSWVDPDREIFCDSISRISRANARLAGAGFSYRRGASAFGVFIPFRAVGVRAEAIATGRAAT